MDKQVNIGAWGPKKPKRDAIDVFEEAKDTYKRLSSFSIQSINGVNDVRRSFMEPSRSYYSLAAASRRRELDENLRRSIYGFIFQFRSALESKISESLMLHPNKLALLKEITKQSFFGRSIKQGVSIRYPLSTCVPTSNCGGRCYAHDGRDRDYQRLFRGVLNGLVGAFYEEHPEHRNIVINYLSLEIDRAIASAREEARSAFLEGYKRKPRIRFAHVGEMAATPLFTNHLAKEIRTRAPDISCVVYTRHPKADQLDSSVITVNFTVEGSQDSRIEYLPRGARLVSSSWDGKVYSKADINFLEHHVEKGFSAIGHGNICPVTFQHEVTPTCDSAKCERCFANI